MMMECPRCGFAQPKDKYCANCGVDMEQLLAQPKPIWIRLLQNSNLRLVLIALLVVGVVLYILRTHSGLVGRQMDEFLRGAPISSRNAGEPEDVGMAAVPPPPTPPAAQPEARTFSPPPNAPAATVAAKPERVADLRLEVSHWEVPRDILVNLISTAEKIGESNEGRAYLWARSANLAETLQKESRRLSLNRNAPLQTGSQVLSETAPTSAEAFQFGLLLQITRAEKNEANVRWESTLVLPQPETPAEAAGTPVLRAVSETSLAGSARLTDQALLMIVIEPSNRAPREEYISRAGEGPWNIFMSEDFHYGLTDWVILVQLK